MLSKWEIIFLFICALIAGYIISLAVMLHNYNIKKNCKKIVCEIIDELNVVESEIEKKTPEEEKLSKRRLEILSYLEKIYGYKMNKEVLLFIKSSCNK